MVITGLGIRFLDKHGKDMAIKVIGKAGHIVSRWVNGSEPSVADLQRLIDFDPSLVGAPVSTPVELPAIEKSQPEQTVSSVGPTYEWPQGTTVAVLMPSSRGVEIETVKSMLGWFERDKMTFIDQSATLPVYARNKLAAKFLAGNWPWSFWLDSDIVPPTGDVDWFREISGNPSYPAPFARLNPLVRLMSSNRKFIGGCYFGRHTNGKAQFNEAHVSPFVNNGAHGGPNNSVLKTRWVAAGCTLVHRDVYLDIIKTFGDKIRIKDPERRNALGYEYRFFTPQYDDPDLADNSEDVSFCDLAEKSGHEVFVDHAIMPAHMGKCAYGYHNTKMPVRY